MQLASIAVVPIDRGIEKEPAFVGIRCAKGRGVIMPGGKPEEGETFSETAIRELHEETGLVGHNPQFIYGGPDGYGYYVHAFLVQAEGIPLKETREGEVVEATWKELLRSSYAAYYELLKYHLSGQYGRNLRI